MQIKKEIETVKKIKSRIHTETIEFIIKHPDLEISAEVLMGLPMDLFYKYYPPLSKKVQNLFIGNYAEDVLYVVKKGDTAPSFLLRDHNGKIVTLSDLKDKICCPGILGDLVWLLHQGHPRNEKVLQ